MKCALLLVILMVTVSFICGTQSDSVLKKILSVTGNDPRLDKARDGREKYGPFGKHIVPKLMEQANRRDGPLSERSGQDSVLKKILSVTGNDPWLDKARDGREKYGPFRKQIVPKSMKQANRRDGPLSERSGQPDRSCRSIGDACAKVERVNGQTPVLTSLCNCTEWPNTNCNENWEDNSADTVTWKSPNEGNKVVQLKFCMEIGLSFCQEGEKAGSLTQETSPVEEWDYLPECMCKNPYTIVQERRQTVNGWKLTLICGKSCSSGAHCAEKFTELYGDGRTSTTVRYFCTCPRGEKCSESDASRRRAIRAPDGEYYTVTSNITCTSN